MFLVEPDKLDIKGHLRGFLFIMHYQQIQWRKDNETNEKQTQLCLMDGWMDGWMTYDLTSFLTVFQLYQDGERMTMKGCVQWNTINGWEEFSLSGTQTWER